MAHDKEPAACRNCGAELPASDVIFCPHCGQRNTDGKVSMWEFISRFLQHFTHLNNKFVRTIFDLPIPGKMTEVYFRGKRKRYPHPVQLFFIVMFFFILLANSYLKDGSAISLTLDPDNKKASQQPADQFYLLLQQQAQALRLHQLVDSLPHTLRTPEVRVAADSLIQLSQGGSLRKFQESTIRYLNEARRQSGLPLDTLEAAGIWTAFDSLPINLGYQSIVVSVIDLTTLDEQTLIDKYGVTGSFNRLLFRQALKTLHNPAELVQFYVGSLSWTIFILIAVMAGVLYLLFWFQRRYYIEHFVLLVHWHSGMLLLITAVLAINKLAHLPILGLLLFLWFFISLFWAFRRYYKIGAKPLSWRYGVFLTAYAGFFFLFFTLSLLGALALF